MDQKSKINWMDTATGTKENKGDRWKPWKHAF